jgi:hypothetical protein
METGVTENKQTTHTMPPTDGEGEWLALSELVGLLLGREELDAVEIEEPAHQLDRHAAALRNHCISCARFVLPAAVAR